MSLLNKASEGRPGFNFRAAHTTHRDDPLRCRPNRAGREASSRLVPSRARARGQGAAARGLSARCSPGTHERLVGPSLVPSRCTFLHGGCVDIRSGTRARGAREQGISCRKGSYSWQTSPPLWTVLHRLVWNDVQRRVFARSPTAEKRARPSLPDHRRACTGVGHPSVHIRLFLQDPGTRHS